MDYYFPYTDSDGFVHSIDMVYCEYFSFCSPEVLLSRLQEFHLGYPDLEYAEFLERPFHSKYSFYRSAVRLEGVFVEFGKYTDYDREKKIFRLLPMFQIRFNPNKYMALDWFRALLLILLDLGSSGVLRKYDYAIDLNVPQDAVQLFDCRREKGLFKGTRYFGQAGRHGYIKIYDKFKDLFRQGMLVEAPLTRVEQTFLSGQAVHLEPIYVMDRKLLEDFSGLKDTDRAIIEMYSILMANGISYELSLGRGKSEKLRPYLYGGYKLVQYGDILDMLLKNIRQKLQLDQIIVDEAGFMTLADDEPIPFEF